MKKAIALLVSFILILAVSLPTAAITSTITTKKAPPETLTVVLALKAGGWEGISTENFSSRYIEQKTNIKFKITTVVNTEIEKRVNVLLASGVRPDIFQYVTADAEQRFINADILLPVNQYFSKAPNLLKYGQTDGIWDACTQKDGNIYSIPIKSTYNDNIPIYRKDWLDKVGLKVPTTIDEFYNVCKAFTFNDPDGDGKKDTYAMDGYTNSGFMDLNRYDNIFGAYGVLPRQWLDVNGKLVLGSVQPGALEALKFMNKMYKEGLIDPEFVTDNQARFKEKILTGKYGTATFRYFLMDSSNLNNYYEPFHKNNPTGEIIEGPLLKGPAAKNIGISGISKTGWIKTGIYKNTKHLNAILGLFNWLTSEEGIMFENYGLEGKHYVMNNGILKQLVDDSQIKKLGLTQFMLAQDTQYLQTSVRYQQLRKYATSIMAPVMTDGLHIDSALTSKEFDIDVYSNAQYIKMIMSSAPIDDMFADMVKGCNERGLEAVTKAYDAEYQIKKASKK